MSDPPRRLAAWLLPALLGFTASGSFADRAPLHPGESASRGSVAAPASSASIAPAGGGTVVVWAETRRGVSRIFAQCLDASGARQWPDTGLVVSDAPGEQVTPALVAGDAGTVIVAWMNATGSGERPYAQALDAGGQRLWGANGVAAGGEIPSSSGAVAAPDGRGGILLAWDEFISPRIHAQRVDASGAPRWGGGGDVVVCTSAVNAINPAVASDGAGGAIVAWMDYRLGTWDIFAARVDSVAGLHWTPNGAAICTVARDQWYPQLASDGAGGAILAWQDYRTGVADIYGQRVNAVGAGQWGVGGAVICDAADQQYSPVIAADGLGGAIVAWQDYRAAGIADIYAQRVNAAGAGQLGGNGLGVCTAAQGQYAPALLPDGAGGTLVAWEDFRSGDYAIYAQSVSVGGLLRWAADGVPLCTAPGNQLTPWIAADGAGGAVVAWPDSRVGDADIYAQRVSGLGVVQWATDGVPVYLAPGIEYTPLTVATHDGGAILVWKEKRGGDYDIVASRFGPEGSPLWPETRVCFAPGVQAPADAISDGADGLIVAWQDPRNGNADIYAQRVDATGAVSWGTDGVAVCAAAGAQVSPRLAADGAGGAVVTWQDGRAGNADIYAQRVDAAGTPSWAQDGVPLCMAPGDQLDPEIATDGAGGGIVTWQDGRTAHTHIYAGRVDGSGTAQWAADGVAICTFGGDSTGSQWQPVIVADAAGGAVIAWSDARGTSHAQRVDRSGTTSWTPDGVALSTTPRHEFGLSMTSNGEGGAIAVWVARSDTTFCKDACPDAVFGQYVDDDGTLRWPVKYGATVYNHASGPSLPALAPDGDGGIFATFTDYDYLAGLPVVLVQHVDSAGVYPWGPYGLPADTVAARRLAPSIAADGTGGALVAWQQFDGYRWIVHGQHFDRTGRREWTSDAVTGVEPPRAAPGIHGFGLGPVRPNPSTGSFRVTYSLPDAAAATLEVLDVTGRRVRVLALGGFQPGAGEAGFGARSRLAPGVYLVRLRQGGRARTTKAVVLE